jgi:hypothetical protein
MTTPTTTLISALASTVARLRADATFRWTHMGACTCGHLAQTLTDLPREAIHRAALQRAGDWGEQAIDVCPTSGLPMDHILQTMFDVGLTSADIAHLERLSDPRVLARFPLGERHLDYRRKDDVIRYLEAFTAMLREAMLREALPTPPRTAAADATAASSQPALPRAA